MRNLRQLRHFSVGPAFELPPDACIRASTWDTGTSSIICAYTIADENTLRLARIKETEPIFDEITSWEPEIPDDTILSIYHLADTVCTCVIFASGNIVLINEEPAPVVEIVGCIDAGIAAASWSPDEEVLAVVTNAPSLLLMTRDIEPIGETFFTEEDLNATKHVSVGWGKAETQFQGKRAKAMRDPTVPERVDQGILSPEDDGAATISWRGDGEYLAVSSQEKTGDKRVIRVFTREGRLESVTQPVDGLESPLSWKPSGSLIAGVQRTGDVLDVVFFERNGLRHGEFRLDTAFNSQAKVRNLHWNYDSSVLAVVFGDRVQLWSTGNYHWYLKREIFFTEYPGHKGIVSWHPEQPLKCFIPNRYTLTIMEFTWTVSGGTTLPLSDHGLVSVHDGRSLKLTPLRIANVPPPMAHLEVPIHSTPVDTAIGPDSTKVAVLLENSVELISWSYGKRFTMTAAPTVTRLVDLDQRGVKYRQISFIGETQLELLGEDSENYTVLRRITFDSSAGAVGDHFLKAETRETPVVTVTSVGNEGTALLHKSSGDVVEYNIYTGEQTPVCDMGFRCPTIQANKIGDEITVFGLSENGKLSANGRVLSTSCSSFTLIERFLIFTTNQHVIKFVHLTGNAEDLDIPGDESVADERCRNVERGSKLVTVMPTKSAVVLQMPRGNLETIYPRALVLEGIRDNIRSGNYRAAFLSCRDHRVDMNILYDYAPEQFMSSIDKFVQQLKKAEHLDLFISQLRDEDVTVTLYPETAVARPAELKAAPAGKVNEICNALIAYMKEDSAGLNVQSVITAHVCKLPPDLEAAITLIASLKGTDGYDQGIVHISFLSDVNKLYDTALGIYSLEMALQLAQQAQKDPREYLPFLNSLQEMTELRRRFTIDDRLGRTAKALGSLYEMGDEAFEEATNYTQKHKLYTEAFRLYKYQHENLKAMTKVYANYLVENSNFKEAALAYEWLKDMDSAMEYYRKAGMWQECLFIATSTGKEVSELASDLANTLIETKDYCNAARMHLDYRGDIEEGVRLYCKGNAFSEAMRIASVNKRFSLLETVVDPELHHTFGSTSETMGECKGQLLAQSARIAELRKKKKDDPLAFFDGVTETDAPDNVSLAPTNATTSHSLYTRYTGVTNATALTGVSRKTSKNRRKEERKRARGKKGSVYEEEYLMNSIRRLVERVETVAQDTQRLVECLYRRGMRGEAHAVQEQLQELLGLLRGKVEEVFKEGPQIALPVPSFGPGEGGEQPPVRETGVPVIKSFEGLTLV